MLSTNPGKIGNVSFCTLYYTQGGYRACNRLGIAASTSPFLKVTFETAAAFLVSSTLHGDVDRLTSPASRIVVGQPVAMGTGAMGIVQKLHAEESVMV